MEATSETKYDPVDQSTSIQYILYNSPYGSIQSMINDLEAQKQFQIEDEKYQEAIRDNLELHCEVLTMKNTDDKCIAFNRGAGTNDTGRYYDNHFLAKRYYYKSQEIVSVEDTPESEIHQKELISKLGAALKIYLDEFFGNTRDFNIISSPDKIDFVYTAKTKNPANFYNGYWLGVWSFDGTNLKGRVDNRCHIFESGNVHFHEYKDFTATIEGSTPAEQARQIIHDIMNCEKKIGQRLAEYYNTDTEVGSTVFKGLRRPLPFTKQKMDWDVSVQQVIASIRANDHS